MTNSSPHYQQLHLANDVADQCLNTRVRMTTAATACMTTFALSERVCELMLHSLYSSYLAQNYYRYLCLICDFSDGDMEWEEEEMLTYPSYSLPVESEDDATDFDSLLLQAQQKLCSRKC